MNPNLEFLLMLVVALPAAAASALQVYDWIQGTPQEIEVILA
jgi:hypothetical protein